MRSGRKSICESTRAVVQQNEILVSYLAKRQNATLTSNLLNATSDCYLGQRQRHQGKP